MFIIILVIIDKPHDITPTAIFGEDEAELSDHFMKVLNPEERLTHVTDYLLERLKAPNPVVDMAGVGIVGMTNAAYLSQFLETREIMEISDMAENTFSEQLQHLHDDLVKRGIGNYSLAQVSTIEELEHFTAEEFEEMLAPVWDIYPYRDEGFVRRKGMSSEEYSFCQWSQEWSIESSSVSCVIARYRAMCMTVHY